MKASYLFTEEFLYIIGESRPYAVTDKTLYDFLNITTAGIRHCGHIDGKGKYFHEWDRDLHRQKYMMDLPCITVLVEGMDDAGVVSFVG